jgi:gluconolactonase
MDVKCDEKGNVYAACGDGLEIWNPGAVLLGVVDVSGTVATHFFHKFDTS